MTKVYVNKGLKKNGQPSKTKFLWASFMIPADAYNFADKLKATYPAWVVTMGGAGKSGYIPKREGR